MPRDRYYRQANLTAQRFDDNYPGTDFTYPLKRCVWHSTETGGWPSYGGGASAPTFTAMPDWDAKRISWRQHFPVDMSARALRNESGGVQTNTDECVQVEIVGTCDPVRHSKSASWLYTPQAPLWFLEGMGHFAAWLYEDWGIPLTAMPIWQPYPASYGATGNRMTYAEWTSFRGHCGHQHVPENTHGDPGKLAMNVVMTSANDVLHPPTSDPDLTGDDMRVCKYDSDSAYVLSAAGKRPVTMATANRLIAGGVPEVKGLGAVDLNQFPDFTSKGTVGGATAAQLDTMSAGVAGIPPVLAEIKALVTPPVPSNP